MIVSLGDTIPARPATSRLDSWFGVPQIRRERVMGLEPTTTSLATRYSTTELHPRVGTRLSLF